MVLVFISELETRARTEKQSQLTTSLQCSGGSSFFQSSSQFFYDDFQSNERLVQLEETKQLNKNVSF